MTMMESTSTELYGVPWHKVGLAELLRLLELNKVNGERKIQEFQQRRIRVKDRQDFLQKRRIARLRMEGIIIDLEAVKRRCKAPKESLWYEDVDEEEKQRAMKKRLKEMFKAQYYVRRIEERSDSSSDESTEDKEVAGKPMRGGILRNYTVSKTERSKEKSNKEKKTVETEKTDDPRVSPTPTDKAVINKFDKNPGTTLGTDKKPAQGRFRKAAKNVTAVNRVGGDGGEKIGGDTVKSISPIGGLPTLSTRPSNSSAGRMKSPILPRISSGSSRLNSGGARLNSGGARLNSGSAKQNSGGRNK